MRRFHPVRALRGSGWRSRAAVAFVVAGVIAGPLGAGPAGAHGTGVHRVLVLGTMNITDIDGGPTDPFPDVCNNVSFAQEARYQSTSSTPVPVVNIDIVRNCDEATGFLRVNAVWRPDLNANINGFARVTERDCFLGTLCNTDFVGQRSFNTVIAENTGQFGRLTIGDDQAVVEFNFQILILSP